MTYMFPEDLCSFVAKVGLTQASKSKGWVNVCASLTSVCSETVT